MVLFTFGFFAMLGSLVTAFGIMEAFKPHPLLGAILVVVVIVSGVICFLVSLEYGNARDRINDDNEREYKKMVSQGIDPSKGNYKNPGFIKWLSRVWNKHYKSMSERREQSKLIRHNYKD